MRGRSARATTIRMLPAAAPVSRRPATGAAGRAAGAAENLAPLGRTRPARRRVRVRWGRLAAFVLGVYLAAGLVMQQVAFWQAQRELRALEAEAERVAAENRALRERIQFARGEEYIHAAARERLGLVRPGETVIQLVDPATPAETEKE
ncbi:MAG TPA: septum formation initiator family protein [Thermaerobacter sp.]